MITVYEAFKLILGIVASVFIIYFLINYSGAYSRIQGSLQKNVVVKNFLDTANNVYLSGISTNYTDFSRIELDLYYKASDSVISFSGGSFNVRFPLLFRPGREVYIYRNALDYGWWRFYFVGALPETDVIINPLENTESVWDMLRSVVWLFPSTAYTKPKVRFGFCNGADVTELYDQYDFLNLLYPTSGIFEKCNATLKHSQVLVTVSGGCDQYFSGNGICLTMPDNGIGYVFINSSDTAYFYKDPVDIAAAIIGGNEKDEFGVLAEELFIHKNLVFAEELAVAAKIMGQRAVLIAQKTAREGCDDKFIEFRNKLAEISSLLSEEYYKDSTTVASLQEDLGESSEIYSGLVNMGCEAL